MNRSPLDYLILALKGMAMGAADVVPGVSGGTIAFVSGIYEELIATLNKINFSLLKQLKNEGLKSTWKTANGSFLLALLSGVFVSVISLAKGDCLAFLRRATNVYRLSIFSVRLVHAGLYANV